MEATPDVRQFNVDQEHAVSDVDSIGWMKRDYMHYLPEVNEALLQYASTA